MRELILKNKKFRFTTSLKINDNDEVISSIISFDEPIELSTIFPGRGILFGIPQQPHQQPKNNPSPSRFPVRKGEINQKDLPDWLVKDLKRRENGKA